MDRAIKFSFKPSNVNLLCVATKHRVMIKCHFFCCRLEDSDVLNCCQGETVEGINEIERGLSGTEEG